MNQQSGYQPTLQRIALLLVSVIFLLLTYTTLHESGHALAVLLQGGTIRHIDINFIRSSPHVSYNGTFTGVQKALISISGWGFPVLIFLLLLVIRHKEQNAVLVTLRWMGGLCLTGSTLPWVVIPIIYMTGGRPADDVTVFLTSSGLPPLGVALAFAVLTACSIYLMVVSRNQLFTYINWLQNKEATLPHPGSRRTLGAMSLITVILIGLLLVNGASSAGKLPQGYRQVVEFNLEQANPDAASVYTFEKTEAGPLYVYLIAQDIRTDLIDVTLRSSDGWTSPILHGEGFWADETTSNPGWETLPAGQYELVVAGTPAQGTITLYLKP